MINFSIQHFRAYIFISKMATMSIQAIKIAMNSMHTVCLYDSLNSSNLKKKLLDFHIQDEDMGVFFMMRPIRKNSLTQSPTARLPRLQLN